MAEVELSDLFNKLVVAAWTDELCDQGWLHRPKVWASKAPDLKGVRMVAGDYSVASLARRSNRGGLRADIVETWKRRAQGKRTVAFAVNVAHSRAIAEAFRDAGVTAEHLDGKTSRSERDAILSRLATGQTNVVSNCMVLTEGWDLPALECAIIARPTASLNLHLQMVGRVMRACDGKDGATVLDHADNHHRHGLVTRRLDYTLTNDKVSSADPLGLRRCGECGLLFDQTTDRCPECGWAPPATNTGRYLLPIHRDGELIEFDEGSFAWRKWLWRIIEHMRETSGHSPNWSCREFIRQCNTIPIVVNGELIDPEQATLFEKRVVFERLARAGASKDYKRGWASHRFKEIFGHWPHGFVANVRREVGA